MLEKSGKRAENTQIMKMVRNISISLVFFALATLQPLTAAEEPALEIRSPGRFAFVSKQGTEYRAPVRFNDDHDTEMHYQARRFWRCAELCPDGGCDHRTHEPVWDYRYVGGRVQNEDDLLEITLISKKQTGGRVRLDIEMGARNVRLWPDAKKGRKSEILTRKEDLVFDAASLPATLYVEGIRPGTARFRLCRENGENLADEFVLHVDVAALKAMQQGRQMLIYRSGGVTLSLEPEAVFRAPAYRKRITWSGDATGEGQRMLMRQDPGETAELRRATYLARATIADALTLKKKIRVKQRVFTGSPVAETTEDRRREVESLLPAPRHFSFKNTELPNNASNQFSQAWFEKQYTGSGTRSDPVKPVNAARLQYAPRLGKESKVWGIACCYLKPYGVFITRHAYESGLKKEDLIAVAHHELRHLEHYSVMYSANGFWHVLCRSLEHKIASYFMEADASSASLHSNCSWRYMDKCCNDLVRNYRLASGQIETLPSIPQIESAVVVLQDVYRGIPTDMDEFKRPGYECYIRPPLEIDDSR